MSIRKTKLAAVTIFLIATILGIVCPCAVAQTPEACAGQYAGTYDGDFSGDTRGSLSLSDPGFCDPPNLGGFYLTLEGEIAQFFWMDETRTQMGTSLCVFDDLSIEGVGGRSFSGIGTRRYFVSGSLDLEMCTFTGTWSMQLTPANQTPIPEGSGSLTMSLVPPELFWEGLDGDFNSASNWEPQASPDANNTVVFDKNQNYTVGFGVLLR